MRFIKLALAVCLVFFLVKHRDQIHFGSHSAAQSKEQLKAQIEDLQSQISRRREIIAGINDLIAKAPSVGSVVGRSKCGGPITVVDSGTPQMFAEVDRIQREIDGFNHDLEKAQDQLALLKNKETQ